MPITIYLNRSLKSLASFLIVCLFLLGCTNPKTSKIDKKQVSNDTTLTSNPLNSFWENYDFKDTTVAQNPDQSEQQLVNFIAAFPQYPITLVKEAIRDMLQKAESNPEVFAYFTDKYDHYLYDPNSPVRSDWYYEPVLEYLITSPRTTDTEKIRYKMQLDMVRKNQPGSTVTDFQYLTSTNKKEKLHNGEKIAKLIIFYDPTCPHCKEIMQILKKSELLNMLVAQKQLRIIAIDPMADQVLWKNYQNNIPQNWTNGFDNQDMLINKQMYNLVAYPTLYLIDSDNKVILKDPDYQNLLNFLNQASGL